MSEIKEAWNRIKELWSWTRTHPKATRSDLGHDIVAAYKQVLLKWMIRGLFLFLLTGVVKFFWHIWGKIFDVLLDLLGFL